MDPTIEFNKEIKRRIVNRELMMLYGYDVTNYLPPLPKEEKTRSTIVSAWSCGNQAMRQLGNLRRRGPRTQLSMSLPASWQTQPKSSYVPYAVSCGSLSTSWNIPLREKTYQRPHTATTTIEHVTLTEQAAVKPGELCSADGVESPKTETTETPGSHNPTVGQKTELVPHQIITSKTCAKIPPVATCNTLASESVLPRRPHTSSSVRPANMKLLRRPQTAHSFYTAHVRKVLNTTIAQEESIMTMDEFEKSQTFKRLAPPEDLEKLITPAKILQRSGDIGDDDEFPDYLSVMSGGSLQRKPIPNAMKAAARIKSSKKKGSNKESDSQDVKRLEEQMRVLRGEWDKLPSERPTAVRIYLSANMDDMTREREVLFKNAYPELQEFCRLRGLDFHVVDVRWGAGPSVDTELVTSGLHNKEIHACQRLSIGPCFVSLLGDKYGDAVAPYRINKEEFESLKTVAEENHITKGYLLDEWYDIDENVIPHLYTLQLEPTGKSYKGKAVKAMCIESDVVARMHADTLSVMQECVVLAVEQGKVMADKRSKYFKSMLEEEITHGFLDTNSPSHHCRCYVREFYDLSTTIDDRNEKFLDINTKSKKPQLNDDARVRLEKLKQSIMKQAPKNVRSYNPSLSEYLDESDSQEGTYLHKFCEDFIKDIKTLIEKGVESWKVKGQHYDIYRDVLQHAKLANQKASLLVGRKDTLATLEDHIKSNTGIPFVLYGPKGSGKTTIMAKVAKLARDWLSPSCVIIERFLGAILETRNLKSLLQSTFKQLSIVYKIPLPHKNVMESSEQLVHAFHQVLHEISQQHAEDKPLIILLDGITNLDRDFRAHTLHWLPMTLPNNVHLIVSVETDRHGILDKLFDKMSTTDNFLGLDDLDEKTVDEIFVKNLQKRNRQLTTDQRELMLRLSKNHPKPLYAYFTTTEVLSWASYTVVPESRLPGILEDFIWRHLVRTENQFGPVLVEHMFSYLAVSPIGLTEVELKDALSCNDDVMTEIFSERPHLSNHEISMPSFLLCRILNEVRPLLTERQVDDRTVIMFHHSIIKHVCSRKYFGSADMFSENSEGVDTICKSLLEVFQQEKGVRKPFIKNGLEMPGNRYITHQPTDASNKRKLRLLPFLMNNSGIYYEIRDSLKKNALCNFAWLMNSLVSLQYDAVLGAYGTVTQKDNDIETVKDFLLLCRKPIRESVTSLAIHLTGCIPRLSDTYRFVNELVRQATSWLENAPGPFISPVFPCMPSCYDMCKMYLWGLVDIIKMSYEEELAVVRNDNNMIEIWDFTTQERAFEIGVQYNKNAPNVFCSDTSILALDSEYVRIWEIESARVTYELALTKVLGTNFASVWPIAHTCNFEYLAIHFSDDDLYQTVIILNTSTTETIKLREFDSKDTFSKDCAVFINNGQYLVFVHSQAQKNSDASNSGEFKLSIYNVNERKYIRKVPCGEKRFHSLCQQDERSVVICWQDASFDLYDVETGNHVTDMPPPGSQLTLHSVILNQDLNITFLATRFSESSNSSQFSGLWKWNIIEEDITRLVLIEHIQDINIPTKFHMTDDEQFAVIASAQGRQISVWDTTKDKQICSIMTHTHDISNMVSSHDPFIIYTCSEEECVIKMWKLHRLLPRNLPPKTDITPLSILMNRENQARVRQPSTRRASRTSKRSGSVRSNKSVRFADEVDDDAASVASGSTRRGELVSFKQIEELDLMHMESVSDDVNIWDYKLEMDAIFTVNCCVFSKDSYYVVTGADNSLPHVWFTSDGHIRHSLESHSPDDIGTAWLELGSNDNYVVALVTTENTKKSYPYYYLLRIWELDTAYMVTDLGDIYATACSLTANKERAVIATVDEFDASQETNWVLFFRVIYLAELQTEIEISFRTQTCPMHLQLTEDDKYCITDHVVDPREGSTAIRTFPLQGSGMQNVEIESYKFKKGKKYPVYKATNNKVLRNGVAVAVGLNGDMQLWDIQTCEYEGNLYEDRKVKDTRNPGLHNHSGKMINHVSLSADGRYLLVASQDTTTSLWDIEEEIKLHTYVGHADEVTCAGISDDNKVVISAGKDMQLHVYRFGETSKPLLTLYLHVIPTSVILSPDASTVAVLGNRRHESCRFMLFHLKNIKAVMSMK